MIGLLLTALFVLPPSTPEAPHQCYTLTGLTYQTTLGSAILSEAGNYAIILNRQGVRVQTLAWADFAVWLETSRIRAERRPCPLGP